MKMITQMKICVILLPFLCIVLHAAPITDIKEGRDDFAGLLVGVSLTNIGASQTKEEPKKFVKKHHNKGRDARRRRPIVPVKRAA